MSCQLGRVAVAGSERKQPQSGVLYLWEWDPVDWLANQASGTGPVSPRLVRLTSGGGRAASGALLGSAESRLPSALGSAGGGVGAVDAGGTPSSGGGGWGLYGGLGGSGGSGGGGGGVGGLLAKRENPLKVVSALEGGPLLSCAWAQRGERALVVAGSSAGWLVIVNLMKDEEEAQVGWVGVECGVCSLIADACRLERTGCYEWNGWRDGRVGATASSSLLAAQKV